VEDSANNEIDMQLSAEKSKEKESNIYITSCLNIVTILEKLEKNEAISQWRKQTKRIRLHYIESAKLKDKALQYRSMKEYQGIKQIFKSFAEISKSQACWMRRVRLAFMLKHAMDCFDSWKLYTLMSSFEKIRGAKLKKKVLGILHRNMPAKDINERVDERRVWLLKGKALKCLRVHSRINRTLKRIVKCIVIKQKQAAVEFLKMLKFAE